MQSPRLWDRVPRTSRLLAVSVMPAAPCAPPLCGPAGKGIMYLLRGLVSGYPGRCQLPHPLTSWEQVLPPPLQRWWWLNTLDQNRQDSPSVKCGCGSTLGNLHPDIALCPALSVLLWETACDIGQALLWGDSFCAATSLRSSSSAHLLPASSAIHIGGGCPRLLCPPVLCPPVLCVPLGCPH